MNSSIGSRTGALYTSVHTLFGYVHVATNYLHGIYIVCWMHMSEAYDLTRVHCFCDSGSLNLSEPRATFVARSM